MSKIQRQLVSIAQEPDDAAHHELERPMITILLLAFLVGVAAGLRAMVTPAIVSWGARLGCLHLNGTWLAFLGALYTPYVFTVLAVVELVTDKLPSTASRKVPVQFGARLISGALCGAAISATGGVWVLGLIAGVVGAVAGTLGGATARTRLITDIGAVPAALVEDVVAVGCAVLAVCVA
jgi:uncharacterized membrane protein